MKRSTTHLAAAGLLAAVLAAGCQPAPRPAPPPEETPIKKSEFYRVRGTVVDEATKQGLTQARLRLKATVPTDLGLRTMTVFGIARSDGTYELEIPLPFEAMRTAVAIQLTAGLAGYQSAAVNLGPPTRPLAFHAAPTIALKRAEPGAFAAPPPSR